jgi:hypothetical protein
LLKPFSPHVLIEALAHLPPRNAVSNRRSTS